ncbi:YicC/YloC family endoribonuclease [Aeoliella sp. SH292]|uniref:YicC/YloC family endoribonuclease n=1 Tax=Aeoliella sp. SH292 TaxID=3454464 RepID=UPI003F99AF4F
MLLSMTGFGEAHNRFDTMSVAVELRTINSRHYKLSLRTNEGYGALEPQIDAVVRKRIRRGTVQLNLHVQRASTPDDYRLNVDVLKSYIAQAQVVAKATGSSLEIPIAPLLSLPGVIDDRRAPEQDSLEDWPQIEPTLREALAALTKMREAEGRALATDLLENCHIIDQQVAAIEQRAPNVTVGYRERLTDRVNRALSELNVTVQPADLLRELSLFVDKSDISEEIVRLKSHMSQFATNVDAKESSGRKLEFISQEMGREINTIGSKANDTEISQYVVEMKAALERIREQVQNVE